MLNARTFLDGWTASGPPHVRLDRLLRHIASPQSTDAASLDAGSFDAGSLDTDSLGRRNQRLLALHAATGMGPLEAVSSCPVCGAPSEFALPAEALMALRAPEADAAIETGGRRFRLPRMADLLSPDPRPLAERCLEGPSPAPAEAVEEAGRLFDALDPAADVAIDLACTDCGATYRASLDVARHVAAALDHLLARLYCEIDLIACAYGWPEPAIADLPAERRQRYVAMIHARGPSREVPR